MTNTMRVSPMLLLFGTIAITIEASGDMNRTKEVEESEAAGKGLSMFNVVTFPNRWKDKNIALWFFWRKLFAAYVQQPLVSMGHVTLPLNALQKVEPPGGDILESTFREVPINRDWLSTFWIILLYVEKFGKKYFNHENQRLMCFIFRRLLRLFPLLWGLLWSGDVRHKMHKRHLTDELSQNNTYAIISSYSISADADPCTYTFCRFFHQFLSYKM